MEQLQPRVVNKLTLCFYPWTTIMPAVTDLTGLDNDNLSEQARFDSGTVELLQSFLGRLAGPVCLVAHNGDKYDFPLLQAELARCQAGLSEEILCVDSYLGCKKIFSDRCKKEIEIKELRDLSDLLEQGAFDEEFEESGEGAKKRKSEDTTNSVSVLSSLGQQCLIGASENDTTPVRKKTGPLSHNKPLVQSPKTKQPAITSVFKPRKRSLFSEDQKKAPSFALGSLHTRLLGSAPAQTHGAEADCLALLRMTSALGQDWLAYVNNNNQPLASFKPMWNW